MKKTYNFLMSVAVAAMAFIGCTNTEISIDNNPAPAPVDGVYRQLTFAADSESDASRTHHTGETVHWSKGDRIRIGYTRNNVWQNAEGRTYDSGKTAKLYASTEQGSDAELSVFRVTQLFKDTAAEGELWFYGLYPSEITKRNEPDFSNSKTGEINVYIPWIQAPTATSFDPKADLLVSKSRHSYESFPSYDEHIKMVWTRLVAHGQITLKNLLDAGMVEGEKITFVEFTTDDDDALTGDFTLNIADKTITSKSGSKNKVRLSFAKNTEYNTLDGEGNFVVWFATAPFTATDLTVSVGTDKAIYTRTFTGADKTFKVNTRNTLGISLKNADRRDLGAGEAWELLTDASVLAEGKKVVVAAADYDVAMSTTQNENNRGQAAITKSGTSITIDSDVQVLTVGKGTTDGTWSLYDEDKFGFLYAASTSDNQLKTKYTLDEDGSWTIEVVDGKASVVSVGKSDKHGTMRYNANKNSELFSCYQASNQMKDIALYHNAKALEQLAKPVINYALEVEGNAVKVEWEEVPNAIYYTVRCQKENTNKVVIFKNITDTAVVCDNLTNTTNEYPHWIITVTAYADGYYSNTSDAVEATVEGKTPTVTVEPTELSFTSAGGEKSIEVSTTNLGNSVEIDAVANNDAFDVSVEGTTVTVVAEANPTTEPRSGIITITARGAMTIVCDVAVSQEAKPEGEGVNATDVINREFTGVSGSSYTEWTGTGTSGAVYAGQSAGGNDAVQLRSKNNNSGIIVTKSAGKVSKVIVTWNSNTVDGRTLDIYGKNTAYSAATDLYATNTRGTKLGSIVKGTSTELTINGDYSYIGLRSSDGAMYLTEIRVVWGDGGDAPVVPATPVLSVNPTTLSFEAAGGDKDITCTIENEVSGVNVTASESVDVDWLSTSVSGKTVTVTATTNTSTLKRTAIVTVSYEGAISQTVNITQAGATQSGGGDDPETPTPATGTISFASTAQRTAYSTTQQVWANDGVTLTNNKTPSSSNVADYSNPARFYKSSTIAIDAPGNITKIVFTCSSADYATALGDSISGSTVSGTTVTVELDGTASSFTFTLSDQTRLNKVDVTYLSSSSGGETPVVTPLDTPEVTATAEGNTITVSWKAITGAKDYTVTCGTEEKTVTGTSAEFTGLAYSTKYDVTVVANPTDSAVNTVSEAGKASATTEADPNAGGGGEVSEPQTVKYTVASTSNVTTSGIAPNGSSATYKSTYTNAKCQLTKGNSMTLTLSGYDGKTITGITLSMKSNKSGGKGSLTVTAGDETIASISDSQFKTANWNGSWSTSYVDKVVTLSNANYVIATGETVTITIAATENSLYCQSFELTYK